MYTGLYSRSPSLRRSSEFQKVLRDLVREEEEFEIKLQQAREFARLRKEWERMQRVRETKPRQKSATIHGQQARVLNQKRTGRVHLEERSKEWLVKHSEPSSGTNYQRLANVQSNNDLQFKIQENWMSHKFVLPALEDSFSKGRFVFKESNSSPLPTPEHLHQDG